MKTFNFQLYYKSFQSSGTQYLDRSQYKAVKSGAYFSTQGPQYATDDKNKIAFKSFIQMKCPWIEVEFDSKIDISGLEIVFNNYGGPKNFFNKVEFRVGNTTTAMTEGGKTDDVDETHPLILTYEQVDKMIFLL